MPTKKLIPRWLILFLCISSATAVYAFALNLPIADGPDPAYYPVWERAVAECGSGLQLVSVGTGRKNTVDTYGFRGGNCGNNGAEVTLAYDPKTADVSIRAYKVALQSPSFAIADWRISSREALELARERDGMEIGARLFGMTLMKTSDGLVWMVFFSESGGWTYEVDINATTGKFIKGERFQLKA